MKIPGYRVHRKIGSGGMAAVYLATQESFGRKVALKIIANKAFGNLQLAERFAQEARIVAGLSHPHIVPVYDVGQIGQYQYLAMDYLAGGDLSRWVKAGLEPAEAEAITTQIAGALHYAHSKGYVHRDVKPDNILFREDNSAVLTDFGIARPVKADTQMTQLGLVVGTPAYMSPEQSQGEPIDGRSDLYSLGVILYFMLTGALPYDADGPMALALKHIQSPIPTLPAKLARYQPVINRLLAKSAAERYQSGLELIKALQSLNSLKPEQSPKPALSLDAAPEITGRASQSITVKEQKFRKLGLLTRYRFVCQLQSDEAQHLMVIFSQFTTRLLDWHEQRGKQCGAIDLQLHITPNLLARCRDAVSELKTCHEPFGFLTKLPFTVSYCDARGQLKPLI